jgi:hypothetical protein
VSDLERNIKIVRENLDTSRRNGAYPAWVALAEAARKVDALTAENERLRAQMHDNGRLAEQNAQLRERLSTSIRELALASESEVAAESRLADAQAEIERLRAQLQFSREVNEDLKSRCAERESRLADATALLQYISDEWDNIDSLMFDTLERLSAFLAAAPAQPAEPARTEADDGPDHGEADPDYPPHRQHFGLPKIDPRSVCGVLRQFLDDPSKHTSWLTEALRREGLCVEPARTEAEQAVLAAAEKYVSEWQNQKGYLADEEEAREALIVAQLALREAAK